MSNIELYQSALTGSFPEPIAAEVLAHIENIFGPELFAKTYGHLSNQEALQLACKVLNGLTPLDLKRGIERLHTATWCPRISEFRSWCVVGGYWWTADQAWAKTLNFLNDQSQPITKLAKCVLDEVQIILNGEGQKAAHFAFRDIYEDYLSKAKTAGRKQEFWRPPLAIPEKPHHGEKYDLRAKIAEMRNKMAVSA